MIADIVPEWTWAWYDGGQFGNGLVICHGEQAVQAWLPREESKRPDLEEKKIKFFREQNVRNLQGGFARDVAHRLEAAFRDGEDATGVAICIPARTGSFMEKAWRACRQIPRGQVISYRELARRAGNPEAIRSAGNAMSRNPLTILIPCHRVIGSNGTLWNYGGGIDMKRWLLEREGAWPPG